MPYKIPKKYGHSSLRGLFIRRKLKMSIISAFLTIFGSIQARPSWPNVKILKNGQDQNKPMNKRKVLKKSSLSYCQLLKLKFPSLQWPEMRSNCHYADLWQTSITLEKIFNTKQIHHFSLSVNKNYYKLLETSIAVVRRKLIISSLKFQGNRTFENEDFEKLIMVTVKWPWIFLILDWWKITWINIKLH